MMDIKPIDKICFIGAGYIGGSTAPVMALKNPSKKFCVVDVDQDKIYAWNSSSLPIYEPGLQEIVEEVRGKNLFFTADIASSIQESDAIFIGVNTPTKTYGFGIDEASNLAYWESAARMIAKYANGPKIVVEKSTLPVKTANAIKKLLEQQASQYEFTIISNPEFLAEGSAIKDLLSPSRVLVGCMQDEQSMLKAKEIAKLYEAWVPKEKILTIDIWSSELAKLASNAMLAQRVSSINSIACICEETGASIASVAKAVGMDNRIGSKFLEAGPGFGGSCFKKDILSLIYICKTLGLNEVASYWQQVISMNSYQQKRIVKRILEKSFNTLSNKKVAILGYAFKANTGDTRETPARYIIDMLKDERCSMISIYDPKANEAASYETGTPSCRIANDAYAACDAADIVVVCTSWDAFKLLDWKRIYDNMVNQKTIMDTRNCLDAKMLKDIGFDVLAVGNCYDAIS